MGVDPDHEHDKMGRQDDLDDLVEEIERRLEAGWVPEGRPVEEIVAELRAKLHYPNELARRAAKSAGLKPHRAAPPSPPPA